MMLYFLIEKEFKQFLRNSFLPRMVVMMPLMMMLVLPWAANQEVRHLALCVVDHDESAYTHRLTERIVATDYFHLACRAATYDEALERVKNGEADMVLEFPAHFERDSQRGEHPSAYVATNAVDGTKGTIGSSYLAQILASPLPDEKAAQAILSPLSQQFRFNPHLDYKVFMVPAMMVMLLTLLAGYLPALNIVGEKEKGTIEQMNVSPVSRLQFVMAKLLPFWAVGLFVMTLCLVLAAVVYGLVPQGSLNTSRRPIRSATSWKPCAPSSSKAARWPTSAAKSSPSSPLPPCSTLGPWPRTRRWNNPCRKSRPVPHPAGNLS